MYEFTPGNNGTVILRSKIGRTSHSNVPISTLYNLHQAPPSSKKNVTTCY